MATTDEIIKEVLSRALLLKIGAHSVVIIKKRVADGIFLPGSSADAENYSTKPFAMPIGAVQKKSVLLGILKGKYPDDAQLFRSKKSGKLWVVIKRGYKWLREQSAKKSDRVDLRWTGELMRSLRVLKVNDKEMEIEIGHEGARNDKLASFHDKLGAGKGRKIRKYLSFTEEELQSLANEL